MKKNIPLTMVLVLSLLMGTSVAMAEGTGVPAMKSILPCPERPNCISSESTVPERHLAPVPFSGSVVVAQDRLKAAILAQPRATIIVEEPGYLAVEFRSRLWGFVDEAAFLLDSEDKMIHFRSGARSGYYDFGVNLSRLQAIFTLFSRSSH